MALFGNDKEFSEIISKSFNKFGIKTESMDKGNLKNSLRFNMHDTINNTNYITYALKSSYGKKSSEIWDKIIENDLIPTIASSGKEHAVALIVPSKDIDYVLSMASKKYLTPTVYQLFDGYVVAGFQKKDVSSIIDKYTKKEENNESEENNIKEDSNINDTEKETEELSNENIENIENDEEKTLKEKDTKEAEKLTTKNSNTNSPINNKKNMSLKKKLAAAALLGTSLALVPLATDTVIENIKKNNDKKEEVIENPITNNYFDGIKNGFPADEEILEYIATNPNTAKDELERLANTPVGTEVLKNPSTPIEILEKAVNSQDEKKRVAVAENPSLSQKDLEKLSKDKSENVRKSLAKNKAIDENIMDRLSKDTDNVRENLLENDNLQPYMLDNVTNGLVEDCDFNKKFMSNPCISPELLKYNADNPDSCIREGVASNPNTPQEIVDKLSKDNLPNVRNAAYKNPNISDSNLNALFKPNWRPDKKNSIIDEKRKAALENPKINQNTIRKAALVAPDIYGSSIAKNPSTSPAILNSLKNMTNGKGGLRKFIDDSQYMKNSPTFKKDILEQAKKYKGNPEIPLRKTLNQNFIKDVYNPYNLIEDMRKLNTNNNLNNNIYNNNNINNGIDVSIDTPKKTTYSLDNIDNIPEHFSDLNIPENNDYNGFISPEAMNAAFRTADKIIDNVMADILPSFTGSNNTDLDNSGLNNNGNVNNLSPNNVTNSISPQNNYNPNLNNAPLYNIPIDGNSKPLWLFENACKHIDDLESMF